MEIYQSTPRSKDLCLKSCLPDGEIRDLWLNRLPEFKELADGFLKFLEKIDLFAKRLMGKQLFEQFWDRRSVFLTAVMHSALSNQNTSRSQDLLEFLRQDMEPSLAQHF